jgi:hypothetical protein
MGPNIDVSWIALFPTPLLHVKDILLGEVLHKPFFYLSCLVGFLGLLLYDREQPKLISQNN